MKNLRQAEILNIVQSVDIETQEQMLEELKSRGISATQATISRDIKELDNMEIPGIVGSLAGDDTGILIMRDSAAAQSFNSEVHKLLK